MNTQISSSVVAAGLNLSSAVKDDVSQNWSCNSGSHPKLYGRDQQLDQLVQVYNRIIQEPQAELRSGGGDTSCSSPNEQRQQAGVSLSLALPSGTAAAVPSSRQSILTLITGPSGTGKTALALALADHATNSNLGRHQHPAYFVAGKFDQDPLSTFECYTPIKDAITDYFTQFKQQESPTTLKTISNELQNRLSADYQLLLNTIPIVAQLMGLKSPASVTNSTSVGSIGSINSGGGGGNHFSQDSATTTSLITTIRDVSTKTNHAASQHKDMVEYGEDVLLMGSANAAAVTSADGDECFRFVIRTILQIICRRNKPLILFIDDLQWSDQESLVLLEEILVDTNIQGLMLLGACRGNEVDYQSELSTLLRKLEDNAQCQIVDVQVTNLDIAQIRSLIRDVILPQKPQSDDDDEDEEEDNMSLQLAQFTHEYAQGNAFGTKQMVEFLAKELAAMNTTSNTRNSSACCGTTDSCSNDNCNDSPTTTATSQLIGHLQQTMETKLADIGINENDADHLVALVLLRLVDLSEHVRELLQVCSCLGKDFATSTIRAVLQDKAAPSLAVAERLELLRCLEDHATAERQQQQQRPLQLATTTTNSDQQQASAAAAAETASARAPGLQYQFVHDKIQEASYKLIPFDSKSLAHVNIGRKLWQAMEQGIIDFDAELLVNQFRRGIQLVVEEEDRVRLAQLCLQASWKSGISSNTAASTGYLELGLSLLPVRHWRDHYQLSLSLKCAAAEMNYAIGRHEETATIVKEIAAESRNLQDQARAQSILIYSLGSQNKLDEAINASLAILNQLEEPIPRRVGILSLLNEARRTKKELRRKSDADLLNLSHMNDPTKLAAMNILNIVFLYNFSSRPPTAALIAMRMVRRTVQEGLSAMSAVGFAAYGMILSNAFGDMKNGARYGHLALEVYEIFTKAEWYCRVHVLVWACLMPGHLPIRKCTPRMKKAGIAGLAAGDVEFAMLGMVLYTAYSIISSRSLSKLFKEGHDFIDRMKLHRQDLTLLWHLPLMQVISTLIGDTETDQPAVLTGKFFNEREGLDTASRQKNIASLTVINYNKLTVAATMGEWAAAEDVCSAWEKYCDYSTIMVPVQDYARFLMALASLVRLHSGTKGNRQRRRRARQHLRILRKRLQFSSENYEHRLLLLEAETQFANGRLDFAQRKYHQAIQVASANFFWMEQGIALERMAVCMLAADPTYDTSALLEDAKNSYDTWGAIAKVKQLEWVIRNIKKSMPAQEQRAA